MFCPKCGAEYREGFTECADCKVPLVWEEPQEPEPEPEPELEYVEYEEVLRTFNPADVAIVRSILDAVDITYFIKGEHFLLIRPLADPAVLMVKKDEVEAAKEALKDLDLKFKWITGGDRRKEGGPGRGR
jgi:hypothetical protein